MPQQFVLMFDKVTCIYHHEIWYVYNVNCYACGMQKEIGFKEREGSKGHSYFSIRLFYTLVEMNQMCLKSSSVTTKIAKCVF